MQDTLPKSILNLKTIEAAIRKTRALLLARAKKKGLCENFGQAEAAALRDKFIDTGDFSSKMMSRRTQLQQLSDWAASLSLTDLEDTPRSRITMFD